VPGPTLLHAHAGSPGRGAAEPDDHESKTARGRGSSASSPAARPPQFPSLHIIGTADATANVELEVREPHRVPVGACGRRYLGYLLTAPRRANVWITLRAARAKMNTSAHMAMPTDRSWLTAGRVRTVPGAGLAVLGSRVVLGSSLRCGAACRRRGCSRSAIGEGTSLRCDGALTRSIPAFRSLFRNSENLRHAEQFWSAAGTCVNLFGQFTWRRAGTLPPITFRPGAHLLILDPLVVCQVSALTHSRKGAPSDSDTDNIDGNT